MESLEILSSLPTYRLGDEVYTESFDPNSDLSNALSFFDDYGFVVFRGVFNESECAATREAMWAVLEDGNPGFKHDDQSTWENLKSKGSYGLSIRGPSFHPSLVNNRQNPKLARVLAALVKCNSEADLENLDSHIPDIMVSQDRFTVYRATVLEEKEAAGVDGTQFSTGDRNIHLDMNPWWWLESSPDVLRGVETLQYSHCHPSTINGESDAAGVGMTGGNEAPERKVTKKNGKQDRAGSENQDFIRENNMVVRSMGRHVQCVLNFLPNRAEDGGTLIVPKFHRYLPEFCSEYSQLRKSLPWVQFPAEVEARLLQRAHRITMAEGSVLIWDQRVAHGTAPNQSPRCRMAQYLKAFPRSLTFPCTPLPAPQGGAGAESELQRGVVHQGKVVSARLLRRSVAVDALLRQSGARQLVTPLGMTLFGLDVLGNEPNPCTNGAASAGEIQGTN